MTSIFSNNTIELKHKRVTYTIPKHIFINTNKNEPFKGDFGLYTVDSENFLDGAYSIVVKYEDTLAKTKEHSRIALKISCNTKKIANKIKQELEIYELLMKKKDYSNFICTCYGIEKLKYGRKTFNYITMEYLTCDLFDYIFKYKKSYSDNNIYHILYQSAIALNFLHENNIIYNDLKMENIMISNIKYNHSGTKSLHIKLIDFNCSTLLSNNEEIGGGTLEYMSPELQKCFYKKKFHTLTPKSDVWSIGILGCLLFLHSQPYENKSCNKIIETVQKNIYNSVDECVTYVNNMKIDDGAPSFIKNITNEEFIITLMDMCFKTNISERCSIQDILFILEGCKNVNIAI